MSKEVGDYSYNLSFISQKDFENHIKDTIAGYSEALKSINLKRFNSNLIDPIKLIFDKNVFGTTYEELIQLELHRQRDKTNSNIIGHFHQNIFKFISNCTVPKQGWDVIVKSPKGNTFYVEIKNKHNTMNSSSASKTYMKFQSHLLTAADKNESICMLVEVIAKESRDIPRVVSIDGVRQPEHSRIRRVSVDKFYEYVTGDRLAFWKLCEQLPRTIEMLIGKHRTLKVEEDTVFQELKRLDNDALSALYKLAFKTYEGF
ncbi:type II site-specific deoxyribonuclease [Mycoplasma haemofelis Ohio2]|uniref:Type II site-specific deoxyribonuclease n=1 Tax=Mycoplasma haemofelis (strain Ohio2) TaxID=859194 RepID=F6FFU2_MYCHI|nr:type II site-specific deoxyribonuclease [Mycoplasma haemofelis Ohio2]